MDDDPSYDITVTGAKGDGSRLVSRLIDAVQAALRHHQAVRVRLTLALVDDQTMATLNERHLQHRGPTDVLTFDMRNDHVIAPGQDPWEIDGEVVISTDTADREAGSRGHDTEHELALYAVHGTLHLLGYTDSDEAAAENMHRVEDEILSTIGLGSVYDRQSRP